MMLGSKGRVAPVPLQERPAGGAYRKEDKKALNRGGQDEGADPSSHKAKDSHKQKKLHSGDLALVDQLWFNVMVAVINVANTVFIGLEQDMSDARSGVSDRIVWYMAELIFCSMFIVEMILRIHSKRQSFFMDVWNLLDLLIIFGACIDAIILQPGGAGGKIRLFTVLRLLRIVRLVRLVRMFPFFRELWLLIGGLVNSMKALTWVCVILVVILYVCSVVVTTEIGHNGDVYGQLPSYDGKLWPYEEYFGTVWKSMFTLFQVMTLDGWCDDIVRHVMHFRPLLAIFLVAFLMVTAFGLMNVVVGIIVENILAAASVADTAIEHEAAEKRKRAIDQLQLLLELSDNHRTGELSLTELQAASESPIVKQQYQTLGVKQIEVEKLFSLLDYERRGRVELKRFVNSCRELVGGARRRDIAQVEITVGALAQRLDSLDTKFTHIEQEVASLGSITEDFVQNTVRVLTGHSPSNLSS